MKFNSVFDLDLEDKNEVYYNLLIEEDFDFKTKDITIDIKKEEDLLKVFFECDSLLDLKIATNAFVKSLEVIEKSLNV